MIDKDVTQLKHLLNAALKEFLGPSYGGPSLSYEQGKFVLYTWTDGPCDIKILFTGDTLDEVMDNYLKDLDSRKNTNAN